MSPISFTKPTHGWSSHHNLLGIASEDYVAARLTFVGGALLPAQLAMQQCLEKAAKAVLKERNPQRRFGGASGHRLTEFLDEVGLAGVKIALSEPDTSRVIQVLNEGYNDIRYGVGVFGAELASTLNAFDRLAWLVIGDARKALGYQAGLSVSVGTKALEAFLWRNTLPVASIEHHDSGPAFEQWPSTSITFASPET